MQATRATPAPVPAETAPPRRRSRPRLILAGAAAVAALGGVAGFHVLSTPDPRPAPSPRSAGVGAETFPITPGRQSAEDPGPLPTAATPAAAATADAAAFSGPGGD